MLLWIVLLEGVCFDVLFDVVLVYGVKIVFGLIFLNLDCFDGYIWFVCMCVFDVVYEVVFDMFGCFVWEVMVVV